MIKLVAIKAMINLTTALGFAVTGRWAFAVVFTGCAIADIGSILLITQR